MLKLYSEIQSAVKPAILNEMIDTKGFDRLGTATALVENLSSLQIAAQQKQRQGEKIPDSKR